MKPQRKIELLSAGCPVCEEAVSQLRRMACPSCEIIVLDTNQADGLKKAKQLGVQSVPAVVIDGQLARCCGQGFDAEILKATGHGQAF